MKPWLTIVMPVFNEAAVLPTVLDRLQVWRDSGAEVVVSDGGSNDGSVALAAASADQVLTAPPGRARQMNAGAAQARADFLLFLHADTVLPPEALPTLQRLASRGDRARPWCWGRFDVVLQGSSLWLPLVGFMINWRSRLTRINTGDQALFMDRALFEAVGGFPEQPLMEDVEICKRLRRVCAPVSLRLRVVTSGRRWDANGAWRTIVLMWKLRWLYWRGESPQRLAELYRGSRRQ